MKTFLVCAFLRIPHSTSGCINRWHKTKTQTDLWKLNPGLRHLNLLYLRRGKLIVDQWTLWPHLSCKEIASDTFYFIKCSSSISLLTALSHLDDCPYIWISKDGGPRGFGTILSWGPWCIWLTIGWTKRKKSNSIWRCEREVCKEWWIFTNDSNDTKENCWCHEIKEGR